MNLIKQDVGVWTSVKDELPDVGKEYMCKEDIYDFYKTDEVPFGGDITHWLKPIKQVYPLTHEQLGRLIKDALLWYDDTEGSINSNAEEFLKSITKLQP